MSRESLLICFWRGFNILVSFGKAADEEGMMTTVANAGAWTDEAMTHAIPGPYYIT